MRLRNVGGPLGWHAFRVVAALGPLQATLVLALGCGPAKAPPSEPPPEQLAKPLADGAWLRPAQGPRAQPVWGLQGGLAIGLWSTSGPRGLIRVYAPYLGQPRPRMVNYIAIEPIVKGARGQSELETGRQGPQGGLAMWTGDTPAAATTPAEPTAPSPGRVERSGGVEALTFFLATEPFRNGARPVIQVTLRADRPREVGFRIGAALGSARMDACVLSATMGNYGRLRRLWLRGEVVDARKVWPDFEPDRLGFAPWRAWGRDRLLKRGDDLLVAATTDEADLTGAEYDPAVPAHWRYEGKPATQYWRTADAGGAVVRVNGRRTYWGDGGEIPGGVSYENFELQAPFCEGQEFWFGVTPESPRELGFNPEWQANLTGGR
jgi:hypothetical protein